MNTIRVSSWTDLQEVLFEDSWVPEIERYRSRYAYRGLSDAVYPLEMSSPTARLDVWLQERPELWRNIVIPSELKWEIRDKLDQSNVTERVLFPGLEGPTAWLKRRYSPRC